MNKGKGRRRRLGLIDRIKNLKRKPVIAIFVIVLAVYPVYRALNVVIPVSEEPVTFAFAQKTQAVNGTTFPAFQGVATFIFTTTGAFSEGNPITVSLTISDVNLTNFLGQYNRVGFTDAFTPNQKPLVPANTIVWASTYLSQDSQGNFVANGTFDWLAGESYLNILPNIKANITSSTQPFGPPMITVGPASDNVAQDSAATNQRLTWVLVAFSALMLQPVLEALVGPSKTETKPDQK